MTLVALIDYGSGNVRSVQRALEAAGAADVRLTADPDVVAAADRIVLPGQGAFGQCVGALHAKPGLREALEDAVRCRGRPFLGVCVGLQLLVSVGEEHGAHAGLDWIPGRCLRLDTSERLPHMGWTRIETVREHPVLDGAGGRDFYFAHSYAAYPSESAAVVAFGEHGVRFPVALAQDSIIGVQFHPEKSQKAGIDLLSRFLRWTP